MPRRSSIDKRDVIPDPVYNSRLVTKFINNVTHRGKKTVAERIFYGALGLIEEDFSRLLNEIAVPSLIIWGEDVGTQQAMLISPALWRRWIKPRFASMIDAAQEVNPDVVIWYHSDGYIEPIIPDLIEIGVQAIHPLQPEHMDALRIRRRHGPWLALFAAAIFTLMNLAVRNGTAD